MVECQLPKLKVASSILVARSSFPQQKRKFELQGILEKPVCPTDVPQMVLSFVASANVSLQN